MKKTKNRNQKNLSLEFKLDVLREYGLCGQQIKIISEVTRIVFPGPAEAKR